MVLRSKKTIIIVYNHYKILLILNTSSNRSSGRGQASLPMGYAILLLLLYCRYSLTVGLCFLYYTPTVLIEIYKDFFIDLAGFSASVLRIRVVLLILLCYECYDVLMCCICFSAVKSLLKLTLYEL